MQDIKLRNVKGTFDFNPNEQRLRNYIQDTLKEIFEEYGYEPLETPTLCYYDVLASKYGAGAEILKEVYKLKDQGKRDLALRYDLTVPFARFTAMQKDLKLPFKRYEIGKVFRDGPVKVGRNREFIQCDVDVIGVKDMMIDAEFMDLYVKAFEKLDIDIIIEYNNKKLMNGIIKEITGEDKINEVVTIVDKFKKMHKEELNKEFKNIGLSDDNIESLYTDFSLSLEDLQKKYPNNTLILEGIKEIKEVEDYLDALKIKDKTVFTPTLARGHNIYTGTVFEVFAQNSKIASSIGGGGRYDKIITNFINDGTEYPASGISFGLETIYEILKERMEHKSGIDILIVPINTKKESLVLASKLRKLGYKTDLIFNDRKLNKILNSANKEKIPYVIILGDEEVKQNIFKIKNMNSGEEREYSLENVEEVVNDI